MPRPITSAKPGPIWASVTRTSRGASGSGNSVGDERRAVVGDQTDRLADAQPGGGVTDHPRTQRGTVAVELRERVEELVDVALLAVHTTRLMFHAGRDDRDVRALAAQPGLADVLGEEPRLVEVGGKQVGMAGVHPPQHGEQRL